MKTEISGRPAHIVVLAAAALLVASLPALAHHSTAAEFDSQRPIEFTGTVQKVAWMNPHIYTHVEVREDGKEPRVYRVEGGPPNSLFRQGWRKDTLKSGDTVKVLGWRAKNPESMNVGQAIITRADGRRMFSGENPDRPPAQ